MSKKYNNADTVLAGDLQASGDTFVVKSWEGALFPPTAEAPYKMTHEHRDGEYVVKREVLTVDSRTGDSFHISARSSEYCVQDDSASTKTRTNNALSFVSGDRVFLGTTEDDWNEVQEEIYTNIPQDIVDAKNELKSEIQKGEVVYGASSTGNDGYVITLDPVPTALTDLKGSIYFLADVDNEGSASLNINGLGAKTIKKKHDTNLVDGDIKANQKVEVVYNVSDDVFEMVSQVSSIVSVDVSNLTSSQNASENISSLNVVWLKKINTALNKTTAGTSNYNQVSSSGGTLWQEITMPEPFLLEKVWLISGWNSWSYTCDVKDSTGTTTYFSSASASWPAWNNHIETIFTSATILPAWTYRLYYNLPAYARMFYRTGESWIFTSSSAGASYSYGLDVYYIYNGLYNSDNSVPVIDWIAKTGWLTGESIKIITKGVVNWFTWLLTANDPGDLVYLQDDSSIWVTPWTNEVIVWTIFSDTEIKLINLNSLGEHISLSNNVTYTASSNWIVTWYGTGTSDYYTAGYRNWTIIVANATDSAHTSERHAVCFPVKIGETYKVYTNWTFEKGYFTPII